MNTHSCSRSWLQDLDTNISQPQTTSSIPSNGSTPLPGHAADTHNSYQLQSIACHKGSSIHAGHYVAFVRKELPDEKQTAWVLFNDEKVAKAEPENVEEMKKFAYVYFLKRLVD